MYGLAQELIDEIIDWSRFADADAMKPCGLVCKGWLRRSRYHLFTTVLLSAGNISSFLDLVEASSLPILSFIRDMTLFYNGTPPDPGLLDEVHSTPNLRTIGVQIGMSVPDVQAALDWLNSATSLKNHLRAWAKSSSSIYALDLDIKVFHSVPLQMIVEFLNCVPTITEFSLLGLQHITADAGIPPAFPLELKTFLLIAVTGGEFLFSWLLSLPSNYRLDHLLFYGIPDDILTEAYFRRVGGGLTILNINLVCPGPTAVTLYGQIFQYTTRLEYISLICHEPSTALSVLPLLPSSLAIIKFSFTTNLTDDEVPWQAIDAALSKSRFRTLFRFKLQDRRSRQSLISAETKLLLPLASARGILD
ncbi:hypothetical protein C8R43DRAFT_341001 [Mycena crocata]|nr:hypothetical protein C8R43DRAFT_341001 [Mycena crocata]